MNESGADGIRRRLSAGLSREGMSRRTLLRTALIGAAAVPFSKAAMAQATPGATPAAAPEAPPPAAAETWTEPWIWRPGDWHGQQLNLNVVENQNPGAIVGFGNENAILFSYNGGTPGPTIRMRGDDVLLLRLRNLLGRDYGMTFFGPFPDTGELPKGVTADQVKQQATKLGNVRQDFCLGEHTNGVHTARNTNLHTHGVHVSPGRNPDGTQSDNIMLRLIGQKDLEIRQAEAETPMCMWFSSSDQTTYVLPEEIVGYADFAFDVGNVQAGLRERAGKSPQPHPPGTHWYHPHCHGSTDLQVASGMAGFLIIEGDVDEAINLALTGNRHPDPQVKTGSYDYIERTLFIQRVFDLSQDPDAPTASLQQGSRANPAVNGDQRPATITMRPGAIERWRVLNGSVDGEGYKRFMVLKGEYNVAEQATADGGTVSMLVKLRDAATKTSTPATRTEAATDKQRLYQLAFDGITMVAVDGDKAAYAIRDLATQNAGTENSLDRELTGKPNQAMLANYEACFKDAASVKSAFVRPNEVFLAQGNRVDLFFQAPRLGTAKSDVYTVIARPEILHSDDYQNALQGAYTSDTLAPEPEDTLVAYIVVTEGTGANGATPAPIPDYNVLDLNKALPPVPDYLLPIPDEELQIRAAANGHPADPDASRADRVGKYRTRTIAYSGWGTGDFPLVTTVGDSATAKNFRAFVERDQASGGKLESLRYAKIDGTTDYVLLPPSIRTMAISASASRKVVDAADPNFPITADFARKFMPDDDQRPRMLLNTAEEWVVYNYGISLWTDTADKPAGQYGGHYPGRPLIRAVGQAEFAAQPADGKTWRLQTKAEDHPFHMHQNPIWVTRVEVPDERGNLVNILDKPQWQDVMWLPRNAGRIVFRSRFPDYVGTFVNHCHILQHEDNGMMQAVEVTPFADQANYELKDKVAGSADAPEAVTAIYPRLDPGQCWVQSIRFVDPSPVTGQKYPGFVAVPPTE